MFTLIAQAAQPTATFNKNTLPTYFPPAAYFTDIGSLLNIIIPALVMIAALIFLAMLIFASFKILTSAGDPDKVAEGRNTATFAVIGLVIIAVSFLVVRVIGYVLGIDLPI